MPTWPPAGWICRSRWVRAAPVFRSWLRQGNVLYGKFLVVAMRGFRLEVRKRPSLKIDMSAVQMISLLTECYERKNK